MNRRAMITGGLIAGAAKAAEALPVEAEEYPDYVTFHVYNGNPPGCLAWRADEWAIRESDAVVVGYEPIGMPETFDTLDYVPVEPPVPMARWLDAARFPADAWGEPTFIRVYYEV